MRALAVVVLLAGCGEGTVTATDGGHDGGVSERDAPSAPADAGADAGLGVDAAVDLDSGPPSPPRSAGCRTGAGLAEGEHSFTLEGRDRRYILRLPAAYTRDRAWPVVLALHGNGGSTSYWDSTGGDRDIRAVLADHAILIVVEAIDGNWRDYAMPESTWPARIESELLYFEEVLSQARTDLCVRDDAVFAMGFSGGGSFSGVLACRRDDIRAIAVGGSVIYFDPADCVGHSAAWITIGEGELEPAREDYRDFFRDRAGCAATATDTPPPPCVAYDACDPATPVHYCQHSGGHVWPAFGTQAAWDFFENVLEAP